MIVAGVMQAYPKMIGVGFLLFLGFLIMYAMDKSEENKLAAQTGTTTTVSTPKVASKEKSEDNKIRCRFCGKKYSSEYNGCPFCKKK